MKVPSITFTVDVPPSANQIWRSVRGRVIKSKKYLIWQQIAAMTTGHRAPMVSPVRVDIAVITGKGWRRNRDLDNIAKPILDLCCLLGAIADDNAEVVSSITIRAVQPAKKNQKAEVQVTIEGEGSCDCKD